jgi:probable H4MPT-linked C1 transfer pathway protein
MPPVILGLDIGGANLKAAATDKRAESVPFALWKEPDRLPEVLGQLVERFPEADELAVTMTGELCDCFRTKREGVKRILTAVLNVSRSRPVWVWTTDGSFVHTENARKAHMKVASANWHALATYAGRFVVEGPAVLVDIGSTTTDIIPLADGVPVAHGKTDPERLANGELIYTGMTRTPLCALMGCGGAAEFFATTLDVYLLLGRLPEEPGNTDTADKMPATRACAHARMARMLCSDAEIMPESAAVEHAERVAAKQLSLIDYSLKACLTRAREPLRHRKKYQPLKFIVSGLGEALARDAILKLPRDRWTWLGIDVLREPTQDEMSQLAWRLKENVNPLDYIESLTDRLGPQLSACAPAYAVAVLAAERRP